MIIRDALITDSENIGLLHARSWRTAYRGILSDEYLDNDLETERKQYWHSKLLTLTSKDFVLVAEDNNNLLGFAAVLDEPEAGYDALIDNLHVQPDIKGQGIGGKLMKAIAERLHASARKSAYLWVLNGNTSAAEFYKSKGGQPADQSTGKFGNEAVAKTRFVWPTFEYFGL
jgi:ribosomal protein S18 acetylase RimI-like enzyme